MSVQLMVAIPALNEEATIGDVLARIPRQMPGVSDWAALVIDDGSSDRTVEIARAGGAQVISHPRNLGVGVAFKTAVERFGKIADMPFPAHSALELAIWSNKEGIPSEVKERLQILLGKYV